MAADVNILSGASMSIDYLRSLGRLDKSERGSLGSGNSHGRTLFEYNWFFKWC